MPNWKTHLEVGKRLNKYLKLKDNDYQLFLLGNLLPDINNAFIVQDIKKKIEHTITHFDNKGNYEHHLSFLSKYQDNLHKPLYLGYYVHLYTDYLFNKNFYEMIETKKINNISKEALRIMKQHDFKLFDNYYHNNYITIDNLKETISKINIEEVSIKEHDLINVINYLNNTPFFQGDFEIMTKEELEKILASSINVLKEDIISILKKKRT